jgi:hypothetical protein
VVRAAGITFPELTLRVSTVLLNLLREPARAIDTGIQLERICMLLPIGPDMLVGIQGEPAQIHDDKSSLLGLSLNGADDASRVCHGRSALLGQQIRHLVGTPHVLIDNSTIPTLGLANAFAPCALASTPPCVPQIIHPAQRGEQSRSWHTCACSSPPTVLCSSHPLALSCNQ